MKFEGIRKIRGLSILCQKAIARLLAILTVVNVAAGCGFINGKLNGSLSRSSTTFSTMVLVQPSTSPSTVSTPTIEIIGVSAGEVVTLYSNPTCATAVSEAFTASGGSANITLNALAVGSYNFYAQSKDNRGKIVRACSDQSIGYDVMGTSASQLALFAGSIGSSGNLNGLAGDARFQGPHSIAVDSLGNLYVVESASSMIRKITPAGLVSTIGGVSGQTGSNNGVAATSTFYQPEGIAVDSLGNVFVADTYNQVIRKISAGGIVSTVAGSLGSAGFTDGTGTAASFSYPGALVFAPSGNLIIADINGNTVRMMTPA